MSNKVKIIISISFFVCFGALAIAWANGNPDDIIKVGDQMPDFVVQSESGTVSASELEGKTVLINFFATWCPPCVKELPLLQNEVWMEHKENDQFVLLVVGREQTIDELKKFATDRKLDLPFYSDAERAMYKVFANQTIPRNYIINKSGKVIYSSTGYSRDEFDKMKAILKEALQ